ncbi:MAG: hypothetical protein AB7F22_13695 [Reyranella sp.]|uniref:hypothetical protein n=1 Tax=Reyranella sp. TaxID=1929291 RepID=UPI003D0C39F0
MERHQEVALLGATTSGRLSPAGCHSRIICAALASGSSCQRTIASGPLPDQRLHGAEVPATISLDILIAWARAMAFHQGTEPVENLRRAFGVVETHLQSEPYSDHAMPQGKDLDLQFFDFTGESGFPLRQPGCLRKVTGTISAAHYITSSKYPFVTEEVIR